MIDVTETAQHKRFAVHAARLGVSPETLIGWATKGKRAPDGSVVRLRAVKAGGWRTTDEWVETFLNRLAAEPAEIVGMVPAVA